MGGMNPRSPAYGRLGGDDMCDGLGRLLGSDEQVAGVGTTTVTLTMTPVEDVWLTDFWINHAVNDGAAAPALASVPRVTQLNIKGINMIQAGGVPVAAFDPNNPARLRLPTCKLEAQQNVTIVIVCVDPTGAGSTRAFAAAGVVRGQEAARGSDRDASSAYRGKVPYNTCR